MALPAGRYGVTKNQLLKIKKLPMNTIKLIEELTEKFDLLGTAAFKNSTSVVTQSTDLVESGAVKDIVGWDAGNNLPNEIQSGSYAGVTWIVNEDGSITFNGTATAEIYDKLYFTKDWKVKAGTYYLNGGATGINFQIPNKNESQQYWYKGGIANNVKMIVTDEMVNDMHVRLIIPNGTTLNNVTAKYVVTPASVDERKCDNSVIGTVEDGTTASQAYAVGSHAIRNGAFITWKNAKAQGETINDASDYTSGDVADNVLKKVTFSGTTNASGNMALVSGERKNVISVIMDDSEQIALPYFSQYGNTNIHVLTSSMNALANASVSGTYYYI